MILVPKMKHDVRLSVNFSFVLLVKFLLIHDQTIDLYCSDESPDLKYFCEFLLTDKVTNQ